MRKNRLITDLEYNCFVNHENECFCCSVQFLVVHQNRSHCFIFIVSYLFYINNVLQVIWTRASLCKIELLLCKLRKTFGRFKICVRLISSKEFQILRFEPIFKLSEYLVYTHQWNVGVSNLWCGEMIFVTHGVDAL